MQSWMREALDLVHIVSGSQFARAALLEVRQRIDIRKLLRRQITVAQMPRFVSGESRVRLIQDTRFDPDVVNAVGHGCRIGSIR